MGEKENLAKVEQFKGSLNIRQARIWNYIVNEYIQSENDELTLSFSNIYEHAIDQEKYEYSPNSFYNDLSYIFDNVSKLKLKAMRFKGNMVDNKRYYDRKSFISEVIIDEGNEQITFSMNTDLKQYLDRFLVTTDSDNAG